MLFKLLTRSCFLPSPAASSISSPLYLSPLSPSDRLLTSFFLLIFSTSLSPPSYPPIPLSPSLSFLSNFYFLSCFLPFFLFLLHSHSHFLLLPLSHQACSLVRTALAEEGSSEYQSRDLLVLPLYASLSSDAQQRAFHKARFLPGENPQPRSDINNR